MALASARSPHSMTIIEPIGVDSSSLNMGPANCTLCSVKKGQMSGPGLFTQLEAVLCLGK